MAKNTLLSHSVVCNPAMSARSMCLKDTQNIAHCFNEKIALQIQDRPEAERNSTDIP